MRKSEQDWLDHAAHMARFGWAALTGRGASLRVARRLVASGMLRKVGPVAVVDGDGFVKVSEPYRMGYELTDAGKADVERRRTEQKLDLDTRFPANRR